MAGKPVTPGYGWARRLLWMVGIWLASVLALAAAAWVMRLLMVSMGMLS